MDEKEQGKKQFTLTAEECRIVRKVLQAANLLFTVVDTDYHDNKIDAIIRKLREYEPA